MANMQNNEIAPLFDTSRIDALVSRASRIKHKGAGFLARIAAETLCERIAVTNRQFHRAVDLSHPLAPMRSGLAACPNVGDAIVLNGRIGQQLPQETSLVSSVFALHRSNNLRHQFAEILSTLQPDGLFIACLPGPQTLKELRECLLAAESEITGSAALRVEPFGDVRQFGDLLQQTGFALPVTDTEILNVRYASLAALVKDLRAMGATRALAAHAPFAPRKLFERAEAIYRERFGSMDGKINATVELVYISGWAPHASQQKPLTPGSAGQKLSDFL